ncbi:ATPase [Roseibium aquae]|uniref:ATPase n=1 Tax=Roseibium aquae TaxID=1323746 RepID=A0A916TMG2_9HYPH|nr:ATP12 family protein [Roseibium aquae]GGB58269.1 ATPase [Roseibium aquae]
MRDFLEDLQEAARKDPEQRARELSRRELPKRFYKLAQAVEMETGFAIHLDGRPVKTPSKSVLIIPVRPIAEAVAGEWNSQEKEINPARMPLTRLANTAQDAVEERFADVADEIARFAGNDALCYRADEPDRLCERQRTLWDPVLDWAGTELGGRFVLIEGIMHRDQPEELVSAFRGSLDRLTPLQLAAFHTITTLTGSAVLAFAIWQDHLAPDAVWAAAHVEEDWNIELWGEDAEAARLRAYKRTEFDAAVLTLKAV